MQECDPCLEPAAPGRARPKSIRAPRFVATVLVMLRAMDQTATTAAKLWTLEPLNERWVNAAKPLQDYLTWLDHSLLKMWNVNKRVILEATKLGTAIYKTGWLYDRRPTWTYDAQGKRIKAERVRGF